MAHFPQAPLSISSKLGFFFMLWLIFGIIFLCLDMIRTVSPQKAVLEYGFLWIWIIIVSQAIVSQVVTNKAMTNKGKRKSWSASRPCLCLYLQGILLHCSFSTRPLPLLSFWAVLTPIVLSDVRAHLPCFVNELAVLEITVTVIRVLPALHRLVILPADDVEALWVL